MWLGSLASTGSFRSEIDVHRPTLVRMLVTSVVGSTLGAILLLRTSNATFAGLIPFLLLGATDSVHGLCLQFVIAAYGGFFGAAIGILMLALLTVLGMHDLRRANAFKVLLSTVINGVAVIPFVIARVIAWEPAAFMSIGAIAGGFLGAHLVKRLPSQVVRNFVIVVASTMTAYFFWVTYLRK
jgi:uncharacterized membrane protein YfcA